MLIFVTSSFNCNREYFDNFGDFSDVFYIDKLHENVKYVQK